MKLDLTATQTLVMTPQLQQAIKLLQYSNVELGVFVAQELEQNPILHREEEDIGTTEPADEAVSDFDASIMGEHEAMAGLADRPLDTDFSNEYDSDITGLEPDIRTHEHDIIPHSQGSGSWESDDFDRFATISTTKTLREHLVEQIQLDIPDLLHRSIAFVLLDHLDGAGWFIGDTAVIAKLLGTQQAEIEVVITVLQGLDPAGIFARNLKECLQIQLREYNLLDAPYTCLTENLDLLAENKIRKLQTLCGTTEDALREMVTRIRTLNPKPATGFDTGTIDAVVPDILMSIHQDGTWLIELNPETIPKVGVNNALYARALEGSLTRKDAAYIANKYQNAKWLCKSLRQRNETILRVAQEIVRQQKAFFQYGISHLRPLVLRDIADAVKMHESTISRVTNNKYIQTPRGNYELKYFFTSAIAGSGGRAKISAKAVRDRIRKMIAAEKHDHILSDDAIVELLMAEGITIARRTVAKYREAMRIPSSIERRRQKNRRI